MGAFLATAADQLQCSPALYRMGLVIDEAGVKRVHHLRSPAEINAKVLLLCRIATLEEMEYVNNGWVLS